VTATSAATNANSGVPAIPSLALPSISAQCQAACQKSYQDCMTQTGAASPVEVVQKCGAVLSPCISACK
jgi:hypothetical protein